MKTSCERLNKILNSEIAVVSTSFPDSGSWVSYHSKVSEGLFHVRYSKFECPVSSVLVVHGLRHDYRPTVSQGVLAIGKFAEVREVTYVNVFGLVPTHIRKFDVVLLTYDFLALRNLPIWKSLVKRVAKIIMSCDIRVAMPQDDYSCSYYLDQFCQRFGITHLYSPITQDLDVLYPQLCKGNTRFLEALTGYVDEDVLESKRGASRVFSERTIQLGQRVRHLSPHLGELAVRKGRLALDFAEIAMQRGFRCDVSVRDEDVLLGDDWYRFLGDTQFTIGRKGGASLADPRGRSADKVRRYRARHPEASNAEIRDHLRLKSHLVGNFSAISPRMFETAVMGACQILEEDHYFPGFEPWRHFIPIHSDNLADPRVFSAMRDMDCAQEIAKNAHRFLIESGEFSYRKFIKSLLAEVGVQKEAHVAVVADTSSSLDPAIGQGGSALNWLQGYLGRAIGTGSLKRISSQLSRGVFTALTTPDAEWADHALSHRESLIAWIEGFRSGELIVESIAIPWRSATSYS